MNSISTQLAPALKQIIQETFNASISEFEFQATRKEFEGDITLVVFGLLRTIKGNPVQIGETLGTSLVERLEWVKGYNVVKGFLNIEITPSNLDQRASGRWAYFAIVNGSVRILAEPMMLWWRSKPWLSLARHAWAGGIAPNWIR